MTDEWTEDKLKEFFGTLSFEEKLKHLFFSGSVLDALGFLHQGTISLAECAEKDPESPAYFVLSESDQKKLLDAGTLLKEVGDAVERRAAIFTVEIMVDGP